ncbi:MAG: YaiI/YqxD family protein [Candidatus Latescibacteria bacterium]|nr:YaiI/YqxD family protein [Candidatus Latescibacterota bacterium]
MTRILIDADACPVKAETYRVAKRYALNVILVSNMWIRIPTETWLEQIVVNDPPDAADDWIVENTTDQDIVITADIPLAGRCLEKNARVISPRGRYYTENDIGEALSNRNLREQLRDIGIMTGGPKPFSKQNRSNFLQRLDQLIQQMQR